MNISTQSSLFKVFKDITLKNVCIRRLTKIVKLRTDSVFTDDSGW